jgi:hypothetical protein
MLEELKLNINQNKDIKDQLFGPGTKDDVYRYLKDTIGLTPVISNLCGAVNYHPIKES